MISLLPQIMARCLILTVLIECGFAFLLGIRKKSDILLILLINVITNPVVVVSSALVNFYYGSQAVTVYKFIIEFTVLAVEGITYYKLLDYRKINPFLVSLLLNSASYLSGEIINLIIY